jgi:uncharacterized membrane protein
LHFKTQRLSAAGIKFMPLGLILLIVLIALLPGAPPVWPHSRGWGCYPTGGFGMVLIMVVGLLFTNRI